MKESKTARVAVPILFLILILTAGACSRLDQIPYPPQNGVTLTAANWCANVPCTDVDLGFVQFKLAKPTSSLLIYFLGIMTALIGLQILRTREANNRSQFYWGVSMLFWGLAAISAGTSYQAFSYEIKCAGRDACKWTSWFEIYYYLMQMISMTAMTMGVACSSLNEKVRGIFSKFLLLVAGTYIALLFYGSFAPNAFLVSYEMLVLFTTPYILISLVINIVQYARHKRNIDKVLIIAWLILGLTQVAYYAYNFAGLTTSLWEEKGIWFSDNDVLHVGIVLWVLYIYFAVSKQTEDYRTGSP